MRSSWKRWTVIAVNSTPSMSAKPWPTQIRRPAPNGMKDWRGRAAPDSRNGRDQSPPGSPRTPDRAAPGRTAESSRCWRGSGRRRSRRRWPKRARRPARADIEAHGLLQHRVGVREPLHILEGGPPTLEHLVHLSLKGAAHIRVLGEQHPHPRHAVGRRLMPGARKVITSSRTCSRSMPCSPRSSRAASSSESRSSRNRGCRQTAARR